MIFVVRGFFRLYTARNRNVSETDYNVPNYNPVVKTVDFLLFCSSLATHLAMFLVVQIGFFEGAFSNVKTPLLTALEVLPTIIAFTFLPVAVIYILGHFDGKEAFLFRVKSEVATL